MQLHHIPTQRTGAGLYVSLLQQRADEALNTSVSCCGCRPSARPRARPSLTAAMLMARTRLLHTLEAAPEPKRCKSKIYVFDALH